MSTMSRYTNKNGPFAPPTDSGHTVQGILNSSYFKNLSKTYDKLFNICQKIKGIQNSLIDASGSDINKVNDDLEKVYKAFSDLQDKIDSRGSIMLDNAIRYDNVYEAKRSLIGTTINHTETIIKKGSVYVALMYRYWDTIREQTDFVEGIEYGTDGYIYLKVKRTVRTVDRQNKNLWVFANFNDDYDMEETSDPIITTYNYGLKVFFDGTYESLDNLTFLSAAPK